MIFVPRISEFELNFGPLGPRALPPRAGVREECQGNDSVGVVDAPDARMVSGGLAARTPGTSSSGSFISSSLNKSLEIDSTEKTEAWSCLLIASGDEGILQGGVTRISGLFRNRTDSGDGLGRRQ